MESPENGRFRGFFVILGGDHNLSQIIIFSAKFGGFFGGRFGGKASPKWCFKLCVVLLESCFAFLFGGYRNFPQICVFIPQISYFIIDYQKKMNN
ncbi:hypothetical protein D5278_08185 [bacterium 1XD21-13]|nr:hypothetical protein [bacterium 1XD21-13]